MADGLALVCDAQGRLQQLLYDSFNLSSKFAPGKLIINLFNIGEVDKLIGFLSDLKREHVVVNWNLTINIDNKAKLLTMAGAEKNESLLIIAAGSNAELQFILDQVTSEIDLINELKTLIQEKLKLPQFGHISDENAYNAKLYEELMLLNNELTNTQRELAKVNAQLGIKNSQLTKLNQEKNEFLGIVAHDLKNPLSGILGLADLLLESEGNMPSKELIEYANLLKYNAENMFQLITNLLDVNAIESGKFKFQFELIDILPIVQAVLKDYTDRAKAKNIQLNLHVEVGEYLVTTDANTLRQILDNLISNAIKYSPYNKTVQIYIHNNLNEVRCNIQDQGPGLSVDEQKQLFGKFTRLSTRPTAGEHSTGLGLFIVKKLVTAMNGQVWCESELGEGSTFCLSLPTKSALRP